MSFRAEVLTVLVASPGDVEPWRDVIEREVLAWNRAGTARRNALVMLPTRWEIDAVPLLGSDGQQIINEQLGDEADVVIAVFHSRLGTATKRAASGTDEEIERARSRGVPVHIYIDQSSVPRDHDPEQLKALRDYEQDLQGRGLLGRFTLEGELVSQVRRALDHDAANRNPVESTAGRQEILPADRRLLDHLNDLLPEDSPALVWLRQSGDGESYRDSQVRPLRRFLFDWRDHDRHFLDQEIEEGAQELRRAMEKYLSYLGVVSEWAPSQPQDDPENPLYRVPEIVHDHLPDTGVQKELALLAEKVLGAYAAYRRILNLRGL